MAQESAWNKYPDVLPEDGVRVLVKYTNGGDPILAIFQYVAGEDCFKNADGDALKDATIEAWAPLP